MKFEKDGANGHVEKIRILILMNTGLNLIQPHNCQEQSFMWSGYAKKILVLSDKIYLSVGARVESLMIHQFLFSCSAQTPDRHWLQVQIKVRNLNHARIF